MDEDLRRSQRDAALGDVQALVTRAVGLRRTGDVPDALALLLPARGERVVQDALATFPAWSHPNADAPGCLSLDVGALEGPPRLRWTTPVGTPRARSDQEEDELLLASWLGIVCRRREGTFVLDPETGAIRFHLAGTSPLLIAGRVLLVKRKTTVAAHDLATGEELYRAKVTVEHPGKALLAKGVLVTGSEGAVVAYSWKDPTSPPTPLWDRREASSALEGISNRDLVVVNVGAGMFGNPLSAAAFDLQTGQPRGEVPALSMGEFGWLNKWPGGRRAALGETFRAFVGGSTGSQDQFLACIDRETESESPHVAFGADQPGRIAMARDMVYVADGIWRGRGVYAEGASGVWAITRSGVEAWRFILERRTAAPGVTTICPAEGRLYIQTTEGAVSCLVGARG